MSQNTDSTELTGRNLRALRESIGISQAELADKAGYSHKTIHRWETGKGSPRLAVFECLRGLEYSPKRSLSEDRSFTFIDLFAGIGGLRRAFEGIGGHCVFTSELDKYAQLTYKANYTCDHPLVGDIVQTAASSIPTHDVLLAGFPCQPFSIAGVSKKNSLGRPHGFDCDTQGTLFFEVERILRHHRPAAFLLENVKNLVSHDGGRTFRTIRRVLQDDLGYNIQWKVINARPFVPQHRERIFIVGFRDTNVFSWDQFQLPVRETAPTLRSILHPEDGSEETEIGYTDRDGKVLRKYYLTPHLWRYLQDYAIKHKSKGNGFGFGLFGPNDVARTLSARYYKDGSEILIKTTANTPRRLTPRECARLMGYDSAGSAPFTIPVSDTQAYKQFGNSVVVPVVAAVASAMKPFILQEQPPAVQLTLPLAATA
jgi:DNA (cytosine-5)-methyltransferase 1